LYTFPFEKIWIFRFLYSCIISFVLYIGKISSLFILSNWASLSPTIYWKWEECLVWPTKNEKKRFVYKENELETERKRERARYAKRRVLAYCAQISLYMLALRADLSLSFFLCPSPPFLRLFLTVSFITLLIRAFHQIKFNLAESFAVIRRT